MDPGSKKQAIIYQVLSGFYPSVEISRMNTATLTKFVEHLVKNTSNTSRRADRVSLVKPNWWPKDIEFHSKFSTASDNVLLYMRPILKLLIVKCSEYFRNSTSKERWLQGLRPETYFHEEENDENCCLDVINRGAKRKGIDPNLTSSVKKLSANVKSKAVLPLAEVNECFEGAHEPVIPSVTLPPNQTQFLQYFSLQSQIELPLSFSKSNTSYTGSLKIANCPHIPFSSNVGRVMISNENHSISEELKLRRLEKTDWYVSGKSSIKPSQQDYEVTYSQKLYHAHNYKFPRRQFHQRHKSLYLTPFVLKHFQSTYVRLERLNLTALKQKPKVYIKRVSIKELSPFICKDMKSIKVVMIRGELEKSDSVIKRYSPRLRSL